MIQFAPADAPRTDAPPPVMSLEDIQTRRKLAEEMLRHGMDASPVQHWTQGLARVAQALSGRMSMDQAAGESRGLQKDANDTLLNLYKPSVTGVPMPPLGQPAGQPVPQRPMAEAPLSDDQQGVANFASGMGTEGLRQAMPGKVATALDPSLSQTGSVDRSQFKDDLQNPQIRNQLIALTHAEVGNQGPEAKQAFLESVVNRAAARGQPLSSAINDPSYFPRITQQRAARGVPGDLASGYSPLVDAVAGGSNTAKYATGNASGTVGFNGGPQTAAYGGERFGIEGPDKAWADRQGLTTPSPARTIWSANGQQAQPQTPQQAPQQPTQVADASQGQGMTRETLSRMLANPLTREAAQKYILEQQKPDKYKFQAAGDTLYRTDEATGKATAVNTIQKPATMAPGYRWSADKQSQEAIPGGPADFKQQQAVAAEQGQVQSVVTNLDRLGDSADQLLNHKGLPKVVGGAYSVYMPNWPGSDASNAKAQLDTLKAQVGVNTLQAMRDASKTGGAVGNVTEKEWPILQNQLGSLDAVQSIDQFKSVLRQIQDTVARTKQRVQGVYSQKWTGSNGHPGAGTSPVQPHPAATHVFNPATGQLEAVGGR